MKALSKTVFVLIAGVVLWQAATVVGQTALTNDAVVKMVKAGLAEDVILNMIGTQPGQYSVTPDAMIALKKDGISDKIIAAMVTKGSQPAGSAPAAASPAPSAAPAVDATANLDVGI